ncbi:unannotated protein [freshwater metagenome]|uniref:Unannotated protein n=1 Tax=freshwater metagenome TaxID=449393 RepID=A0A6J7JVD7_9ZZZZ
MVLGLVTDFAIGLLTGFFTIGAGFGAGFVTGFLTMGLGAGLLLTLVGGFCNPFWAVITS